MPRRINYVRSTAVLQPCCLITGLEIQLLSARLHYRDKIIFIDPKRKLVIVSNANWAGGARDPVATAARDAFYLEVQKAIDGEGTAPDK